MANYLVTKGDYKMWMPHGHCFEKEFDLFDEKGILKAASNRENYKAKVLLFF